MCLLSLDISTTETGYAVYKGNILTNSGTLKAKGRYAKDRYPAFTFLLDELFEKVSPKEVVVEAAFYRNNFKTVSYLLKLQGHAEYLAIKKGSSFSSIETTLWRGLAGFPTNFKKTKTKDYKVLSMSKASEIAGRVITNDNEADAICIGYAKRLQDEKLRNKKPTKRQKTEKTKSLS
jgi:Holliday junction resolvasome RuvABC endonuclease subunit